jgi:glycine/D-amino acid oxidase-like deaminating enzyme
MERRSADIFAPGFKTQPFWWDAAPRPTLPEASLPARADVAVVGSGYTGLSAALTLAHAGRSVVVLEKSEAGFGASTRNAGFVGRTFKHSFPELAATKGTDHAIAVFRELQAAFDYVVTLIETEKIDCDFRRCGRLIVANAPRHYDQIAAMLALKQKHLGEPYEMVPKAELHRELASDLYYGGAVLPDLGSLHSGLYHQGLMERVLAAGAQILERTEVRGIERAGKEFILSTDRGELRARDVVVATNGYSGPAMPYLQRRVIPFRGFMIATEELAAVAIDVILPHWRTTHDWHNDIDFLRRSADGKRLLFGGLTGTASDDLRMMAARLRARLLRILPQLSDVKLSHAWNGYCAASFDLYPHIGLVDGIHYAMGYCFAGLPAGTYFGHKTALRILGSAEAMTAFDDRPFPAKWFYHGKPWFVPAHMANYRRLDRKEDRGELWGHNT